MRRDELGRRSTEGTDTPAQATLNESLPAAAPPFKGRKTGSEGSIRCPRKPARLIDTSKLLTPAEVAEITGISIETLAQWRSQKRGIPYIKISHNCVRYRQIDLDQWVGEHIVRVEVDPNVRRV
jgi:predicted DNA-binding transcriptional regulator AlpA